MIKKLARWPLVFTAGGLRNCDKFGQNAHFSSFPSENRFSVCNPCTHTLARLAALVAFGRRIMLATCHKNVLGLSPVTSQNRIQPSLSNYHSKDARFSGPPLESSPPRRHAHTPPPQSGAERGDRGILEPLFCALLQPARFRLFRCLCRCRFCRRLWRQYPSRTII